MSCSIFVRMKKSLSSGQPCHLFVGLYVTFSIPVHDTKHHLDSTTFSKTTLYTVHFFQKYTVDKAALKNHSRTSISRVAETCATTLPQSMRPRSSRPKSLRQFLEVLWKTSVNCTVYRENLDNNINKLQLLKK